MPRLVLDLGSADAEVVRMAAEEAARILDGEVLGFSERGFAVGVGAAPLIELGSGPRWVEIGIAGPGGRVEILVDRCREACVYDAEHLEGCIEVGKGGGFGVAKPGTRILVLLLVRESERVEIRLGRERWEVLRYVLLVERWTEEVSGSRRAPFRSRT